MSSCSQQRTATFPPQPPQRVPAFITKKNFEQTHFGGVTIIAGCIQLAAE